LHQIYNLGAVWNEDELISFEVRTSKVNVETRPHMVRNALCWQRYTYGQFAIDHRLVSFSAQNVCRFTQ